MANALTSGTRAMPKAVSRTVGRRAVIALPTLDTRADTCLSAVAMTTAVVGTSTGLTIFARVASMARAALGVVH